eukprot:TRINITY_DN5063_c0_g1_i1.p1 TRINITY_DN5063_c0_g1~~TRINITY_DN5063_c0_g1_i1.p1  ORF type:complete len:290 (+),score=31.80 TRINITY_DN5063_c0_g1_i1:72-941(+)
MLKVEIPSSTSTATAMMASFFPFAQRSGSSSDSHSSSSAGKSAPAGSPIAKSWTATTISSPIVSAGKEPLSPTASPIKPVFKPLSLENHKHELPANQIPWFLQPSYAPVRTDKEKQAAEVLLSLGITTEVCSAPPSPNSFSSPRHSHGYPFSSVIVLNSEGLDSERISQLNSFFPSSPTSAPASPTFSFADGLGALNKIAKKIAKKSSSKSKSAAASAKQKRNVNACPFHRKKHQKCPPECLSRSNTDQMVLPTAVLSDLIGRKLPTPASSVQSSESDQTRQPLAMSAM